MTTEPFTTEEFTSEEKEKLAGIESGANHYIHPATHPADMISDTAEKVVMTQQERDILTTLGMFTCNKVNDELDVINGESVPGGTPAKLNKLSATKESIRQAINRTGVTVTPEEPFAGYAEKISDIPPVDDWQPNPTWWDIETILKEDTRNYAYKAIFLYADNFEKIGLYDGIAFATSEGAFHTSTGEYTWDPANDRSCVENGTKTYSTRYVIVYSDKPLVALPSISTSNSLLGVIVTGDYQTSLNFGGNQSLQFVKYSLGLSKVTVNAFSGCTHLRSIVLPDSVTEVGAHAFSGCTTLRSVILPPQITVIPSNLFNGCFSLLSIELHEGITRIGDNAFGLCHNLRTIRLPRTLTSIERYAFSACYGLRKIAVPDSVTSIGSSCFESCSSLHDVVLPEGLQTIERNLFSGCVSLQQITIPNSVTSIQDKAFGGTSLVSLTIPASVTHLVNGFLHNSTNLNQIIFRNTVNTYTSDPVATSSYLYYAEIPENFDMSISLRSGYLSVSVLLRILGNLKDNTGLTAKTLQLGNSNLAKLTDEQKAIATDKNWVLA